MLKTLWFLLPAYLLISSAASAQGALRTHADGYVVGWVRNVAPFVDDREGCLTDVTVELVRSRPNLGVHATLRMLGGWCNDRPVLDTVTPGGRRTFSFALGELSFLTYCEEDGVLWIIDKGAVWSDEYPADTTGVAAFVGDVKQGFVELDSFKVHRGFSLEVLRSPDPTVFYEQPRMRRETWFLQQVHDSPAPTLGECVRVLGLED